MDINLEKYLENARDLVLTNNASYQRRFEGARVSPARSVHVHTDFTDLRGDGIQDAAFALVAGGLGQRLKAPIAKSALRPTMTEDTYLLMMLKVATGLCRPGAPFFIMTSEDTEKTIAILVEEYYGFCREKGVESLEVITRNQISVPCIVSRDAELARREDGSILRGPGGHGSLHLSIKETDFLEKCEKMDINYFFVLQDTSLLSMYAMPALLRMSREQNYDMTFLGVGKSVGENYGVIAELEFEDGRKRVGNIEYNVISHVLEKQGEVEESGPDGFSVYSGNSNTILFKIRPYRTVISDPDFQLPTFINPKFDGDSQIFKKPARVEMMYQDISDNFQDHGFSVGVVTFDQHIRGSLPKNDPETGFLNYRSGKDPGTLLSAEAAIYSFFRTLWNSHPLCKSTSTESNIEFQGIKINMYPIIFFDPFYFPSTDAINAFLNKVGPKIAIEHEECILVFRDDQDLPEQTSAKGIVEFVKGRSHQGTVAFSEATTSTCSSTKAKGYEFVLVRENGMNSDDFKWLTG